jgi:hypothetical protein
MLWWIGTLLQVFVLSTSLKVCLSIDYKGSENNENNSNAL